MEPEQLHDQQLFSKFESVVPRRSAREILPNAFECSNLDELLGSSTISPESFSPIPAPAVSYNIVVCFLCGILWLNRLLKCFSTFEDGSLEHSA